MSRFALFYDPAISSMRDLSPYPLNWITVYSVSKTNRRTEIMRRAFSSDAFNELTAYVVACRTEVKALHRNVTYVLEIH